MAQKIIFLDVDGTLVNYENHLPDSAVQAIHKAQLKGNLVFTVTGRSKAEMYPEILDIGFDGYIGGNGSYIEAGEKVIKEVTLSSADTRRIVDWLQNRGLEFYLEANSGLYASRAFDERGQATIQEYSDRKGKGREVTVRQVFPEMIFDADLYRDDINKISFILDSYQDFLDAQADFPGYKLGTWGGAEEKALFGDIALGNINKAVAVDELLTYLDIPVADSFAFGDAKVDIPMLEHCGTGIAMGNGGPEIKKMADYITASVDDDGLKKAFEHFALL
ncbi:Cof-type HAD-IIB family hydrolase [Enterococcus sp. AD013-P3]|uniref:Cof-type HAD-IIB family hydrolase n=1 Tax=Enterococcus sp. AD013-P3 TaxID=3411036 RepID=UPI003B959F03